MAKFTKKDASEVPTEETELPETETPVEEPGEVEDTETEALGFVHKLSAKEREQLTKRAHAKVQKELAQKAADEFMAQELKRLRQEAGTDKPGLGGVLDDIVKVRIDLGDQSENTADPFIQLNMPHGQKYYHGCVYTVPRHIFNTLNEQMWRLQLHNLNKDGKSVFRNRKRFDIVSADGSVQRQWGEIH